MPWAWSEVSRSFVDAASQLLQWFGRAFASIPAADVSSPGVRAVYAISLSIAAVVMTLLLIGQVIRTAFTHDGSALAQAFVGLGKAVLAFLLTLAVAGTALLASDELTAWIVKSTFGSVQALSTRLADVVAWDTPSGPHASVPLQVSAWLIFALFGILLVAVLWFELLLRNAAIAILVATSPIAAAGQVAEATKSWWLKLVSATVQLIILKPVIALVFAVGFGLSGQSGGIEGLLSGLLILLLAVFAWPVIARFFTFANVSIAGGSGLAAVLGFAAGRASEGGAGPAGISPAEFGRYSEARVVSARASLDPAPPDAGPSPSAGALPVEAAGAGAGRGGWWAQGAGAALRTAQVSLNTLAGRMEQTAGHAGLPGANPYYAQPAGHRRYPRGSYSYPANRTSPETTDAVGGPPHDPADHPPSVADESVLPLPPDAPLDDITEAAEDDGEQP